MNSNHISNSSEILFRKCDRNDIDTVWNIINEAKALMRSHGSSQWNNDYPTLPIIEEDIESGKGYVLEKSNRIAAYGVVGLNGEQAYNHIEGAWLSKDTPYVVVHRLAVGEKFRGTGLAKLFISCAMRLGRERDFKSLRVDTNFDNTAMLSLLVSMNFEYCGKIHYDKGERLAYEKYL